MKYRAVAVLPFCIKEGLPENLGSLLRLGISFELSTAILLPEVESYNSHPILISLVVLGVGQYSMIFLEVMLFVTFPLVASSLIRALGNYYNAFTDIFHLECPWRGLFQYLRMYCKASGFDVIKWISHR